MYVVTGREREGRENKPALYALSNRKSVIRPCDIKSEAALCIIMSTEQYHIESPAGISQLMF